MTYESLPPAIFLMGPTGTGKTDLAVELVSRWPCAIISVDSAMIYRGLDIGTAKPSREIQARAPHRLIDIRDPRDSYSAAEFRADALREMAMATQAGKIPLLVGGTGLYFRALQEGLSAMPAAYPEIRARLNAEADRLGWPALHRHLSEVDPLAAARIHSNDSQRIQRALEVYEASGRTMTDWISQNTKDPLPYRIVKLALVPGNRDRLNKRLAQRFQQMLKQGLVEEVKELAKLGDFGPGLPSMRLVGYRQVWEYLEGVLNYATMEALAITATRRLAKRQLTWLRTEQNLQWLNSEPPNRLEIILDYLNHQLGSLSH